MFGTVSFEGDPDQKISGAVLVGVILLAICGIGVVLYHADKQHDREQKALQEEGMYDGTQRGVTRLQGALRML